MKNIYIYLFSFLFLLSFVNAYEGHPQGEDLNFSFSDTLAISCNISTINYPGGSFAVIGQEMQTVGNTFMGYVDGGNFTEKGDHCLNLECVDGYGSVCRTVTVDGTLLSTGGAVIYIFLSIGAFLFFALSFYFSIAVPYKNNVDEKGHVIKVCKLKYVKIVFFLLTWVSLTWLLNILVGISYNFVSLSMFYGLFGFLFETMNNLALPFGIFIIVLCFFEIIRDSNIQENIKKFGSALR